MVRPLLAALLLLSTSGYAYAKQTPVRKASSSARTIRISLSTTEITRIPLERINGAIVLPALIGGRHASLLFDNGSDVTVVDREFATNNGLNIGYQAGGLNTGLSTMKTNRVEASMVVGQAVTIEGQFIAADLGPISRALGRPIAGVIGADALAALIVVINPTSGWVAFGTPGHLGTRNRTTATRASGSDATGLTKPEMRMPAEIPFGPGYDMMALIDGHPVSLQIDYGSTGAVTLRADIWRRLVLPAAQTGGVSASTRADGLKISEKIGSLRELAFGSVTIRDVPAASQAGSNRVKYEGLIGLAVLGSSTTILDTPRRRLWIFPPDQEVNVFAITE